MRVAARSCLDAGITTVRDLGDRGHLALRLRDEFASDLNHGPARCRGGAADHHARYIGYRTRRRGLPAAADRADCSLLSHLRNRRRTVAARVRGRTARRRATTLHAAPEDRRRWGRA